MIGEKGFTAMKISFWGASHTVTGSCYLLEIKDKKFLVDCGMFQGNRLLRDMNYNEFHFSPREIDAVFLTHAHVDHCGLLPKLCAEGFQGRIYATPPTCDLVSIMLPDSAHIQEMDAAIRNRKGARMGRVSVAPLYTLDDAGRCLEHFRAVPYGELKQIDDSVSIRFRDAGHILGSAILELFVCEDGKTNKWVFSGDLGQPHQPIIRDPEVIDGADYLLIESTYGDRLHEEYDKEEALAKIVQDAVERGGKLVIPSFAVGRTQKLLYYFYRLWKNKKMGDIPIIIDSPLAIAATRVFVKNVAEFDAETTSMLEKDRRLPQMPQLRFSQTPEESMAINSLEGPAIIISASGMCDAGRILHHLKHNLWKPESTILFVGYQAEGSLGRRLLEGVKRAKIYGEEVVVRAKLVSLDGFSAHADYKQILAWLDHCHPEKIKQIFVVHGEARAIKSLEEKIKTAYGCPVYAPFYGDKAVISETGCKIIPADIPAVKTNRDMEEALQLIDAEYNQWRKKLLTAVVRDPKIMEGTIKQAYKGMRYMKRLFKDYGIN